MKKNRNNTILILLILFSVLIIHYPVVKAIMHSKLALPLEPDTQYTLSVIEWNQYSLSNEFSAIYHLNYFYPNAFVTFYGHPLFGESLVFYFLNNILRIDIVNSYNLYILFAFFIGGIGVYFLSIELFDDSYGAYLASLIFISYPFLRFVSYILNIFSVFWIGYIFLFLFKFQKNKKPKDALITGLFIFLQGLFSIYHGYFILGIFIPLFFLISLTFSLFDIKSILKFFLYISPFLLLLILIFHPFITVIAKSAVERNLHYNSLLDVTKLFNSNSTLYQKTGLSISKNVKMFTGFLSLALFGIAFTGFKKKYIFINIFFALQIFLIFFLKNSPFISNLLFVLLLIQAAIYLSFFRNGYDPLIKTILFSFLLYIIIFFKFSTLLSGAEFSFYGLITKFIHPLSNFRFLYRGILTLLPIFAVIASFGAIKITGKTERKKYVFFSIIAILLVAENIQTTQFMTNVKFEKFKYRKIEKRKDKIILEIPAYKPGYMQIKDSLYTMNTLFHYNYYINGRTAYNVFDNPFKIFDLVFKNKNFPDRNSIKYLLEKYSVNYIIFNLKKKLPYSGDEIIKRAVNLKDYCRIIENRPEIIILKVKENFPLKTIKRSYSYFHVKQRKIYIKLKALYSGSVTALFTEKKKSEIFEINNSKNIIIDFPEIDPDIKGNAISIIFEKFVMIKGIELVKK